MGDWDAAVRAEYEKSPALTPFSRKPIPYELACLFGVNSIARAQVSVNQREGIS